MSEPIVNHEEALALAYMKSAESNLARCYIELMDLLEPFANVSEDTNCNDGLRLANARNDALACGLNFKVSDLRAAAKAFVRKIA